MTDMTTQRVTMTLPGMDSVTIQTGVPYKTVESKPLCLDIYRPADPGAEARPVVVFVSGYPDPGFAEVMGCKFKDMGAYVSWAQLVASLGFVAINYENVDPVEDGAAALAYVCDHAEEYGIDPGRVSIWACSGNAPCALALMSNPDVSISCAVLCYGYLMDLDDSTEVADVAAQFGFVDAMAGKSIEDLADLPFLLVRAGLDQMPNLNGSFDRFVSRALAINLPMTMANYPDGVHAFDLWDESPPSQLVIKQMLDYLLNQSGLTAS